VSRKCECEARLAGECMCGAWGEVIDYSVKSDPVIVQLQAENLSLSTKLAAVEASLATERYEHRATIEQRDEALEWRRRVVEIKTEHDVLQFRYDSLAARCSSMVAVYEAAKEWRKETDGDPTLRPYDIKLRAATDAATAKETK
jgi:hypothetical protein